MATRVVSLFRTTVVGQWDSRFAEIEVTALLELNSFRGSREIFYSVSNWSFFIRFFCFSTNESSLPILGASTAS